MSDFSAALQRRAAGRAQAPQATGLAQALAAANQALAQALQTGEIDPAALAQLEQMAQLITQFAQAQQAQAPQAGPPQGPPQGPPPQGAPV